MTKIGLFTTLCTLCLSLPVWAAESNSAYFNGQSMEPIKPVQMIGASRSPENLERESQVDFIVSKNTRQLQNCYELAPAKESQPKVEVIFYFTVGADGLFKNLSADVISRSQADLGDLISCSSSRIQSFRAP